MLTDAVGKREISEEEGAEPMYLSSSSSVVGSFEQLSLNMQTQSVCAVCSVVVVWAACTLTTTSGVVGCAAAGNLFFDGAV